MEAARGTGYTEQSAQEVLDRLDDSGFAQDLVEADLLSGDVRMPFREAISALVKSIWTASRAAPPPESANSLEGAVQAVLRSADESSGGGRLDTALLRLARSLDPTSKATHRLQVVEELVAYLQAARMVAAAQQPPTQQMAELAATDAIAPQAMDIDGDAAAVSAQLHALAEALQVVTDRRSSIDIVAEMTKKADELLAQLPSDFSKQLLKRSDLSDAQLKQLVQIDEKLRAEHLLRRHMLTERAKVTLKSFLWSKRLKERGTEKEAEEVAARGEAAMTAELDLCVDDIFDFRQADLAAMGANVISGAGRDGLRASVKGVLIGAVPDRGGRAEGREAQARANMPSFSVRKVTSGGGGRGGGRDGGGRNGRGGGRGGGGRGDGGDHRGGKRHKKK